jgi:hypothetical protein
MNKCESVFKGNLEVTCGGTNGVIVITNVSSFSNDISMSTYGGGTT